MSRSTAGIALCAIDSEHSPIALTPVAAETQATPSVSVPDTLAEIAVALVSVGKFDAALATCSAATILNPDHTAALVCKARVLTLLCRHAEAVPVLDRLFQVSRGHPSASAGLAAALLASGRPGDALQVVRAALSRHQTNDALLRLNADILWSLGLHGPAIKACRSALKRCPNDPNLQEGLGQLLFAAGRPDEALPLCEAAFAKGRLNAATFSAVLIDLNRYKDALAIAEKGLRSEESKFPLQVNKLDALERLDRLDAAERLARDSIAELPDCYELAQLEYRLAFMLLRRGDLTAESWALYEAPHRFSRRRSWPDPSRRWYGDDVADKTVLLTSEQGLGDTIQFVRYAPLVAARGARVILDVPSQLARLLRGTPGVDRVLQVGESVPSFDVHCPMMTLPGIFGTTLETIPPPLAYNSIRPRQSLRGKPLKVGLIWAGSSEFRQDRWRSLKPGDVSALAGIPGVQYYSLQYCAETFPPGLEIIDLVADVQDFADTAEKMAELDLVISSDTSSAHLAATLGKPVWLLLWKHACWRWLQDREDSPWYPSMRIFRQERQGEWGPVFERMRLELGGLAAA